MSSVFTFYIVYATIYYEEPDLVKCLGPSYKKYMQDTPRFIPWPKSKETKNEWVIKLHYVLDTVVLTGMF